MRIAVLVSGSGSNLQALIDAIASDPSFGAEVVLVLADRPDTGGLARASAAEIPTAVVDWKAFAEGESFTQAVLNEVQAVDAEGLVLAGFMRVLSSQVIAAFPNLILNVHPSLLPAFPGRRAVADALAHGVKLAGLTVHFVDEQVDQGPIVAQRAVPILPSDTPDSLHERIQEQEHDLYPKVVRAFCRGELSVKDKMVALEEVL
jgi:phosphoribosylglycinamide formyltransferase-1